jgi:hypothetical protein
VEHAKPQSPQFVTVVIEVSQPSFTTLGLQSSNPVLHVGEQLASSHSAPLAFSRLHVAPHAPQSVTPSPSGVPTRRSMQSPVAGH